ncbi:22466_t:CDS:2, partial [Racocetra persica]
WVQDKKQNWVLATVSPAFTKIAHNIWINLPFTTNTSESAHATINTTGYNLLLSTAITYEKTNVQDSYHNKSSLQRTINSAKRKQKQSTKQSIELKPKKKARYNKKSSSNESSITYEQEQLLNIDYKKLTVQKNLNDELEKEIRL